jgi:hypothetical protein
MENLPPFIGIVFGLTIFLTTFIFLKASKSASLFLVLVLLWITLQSIVSVWGFYSVTDTLPPRMALLIVPPLLLIVYLFATRQGRQFIDSLNAKWLTLLHVVRIPVELVLFWLFINKAVPELMTFEGINFDILAGLTAPLIFYFGYVKKVLPRLALVVWNVVCLGLVGNIIFHGILSVASPFQQFGFEQPNIGLLYFPFTLLPGFVVPMVLFSHLATIRQLFVKRENVEAGYKSKEAELAPAE